MEAVSLHANCENKDNTQTFHIAPMKCTRNRPKSKENKGDIIFALFECAYRKQVKKQVHSNQVVEEEIEREIESEPQHWKVFEIYHVFTPAKPKQFLRKTSGITYVWQTFPHIVTNLFVFKEKHFFILFDSKHRLSAII